MARHGEQAIQMILPEWRILEPPKEGNTSKKRAPAILLTYDYLRGLSMGFSEQMTSFLAPLVIAT